MKRRHLFLKCACRGYHESHFSLGIFKYEQPRPVIMASGKFAVTTIPDFYDYIIWYGGIQEESPSTVCLGTVNR
jgi:hypothetical protein